MDIKQVYDFSRNFFYVQSVERQVTLVNVKWLTQHLWSLLPKMASIFSQPQFLEMVALGLNWGSCKVSAPNHLYFESYRVITREITQFH